MTLLTCKVDEPYYGIDLEVFGVVRGQEANYFAIKKIWNPGIELVLIYKRFLRILSNNIGFVSMIDCGQLSNKEMKILSLLGVPKKCSGIFINDMRMSVPQRRRQKSR